VRHPHRRRSGRGALRSVRWFTARHAAAHHRARHLPHL